MRTGLKTWAVVGAFLTFLAGCSPLVGCYPERYFPRMRHQLSLKAEEAPTPPMPAGVIPAQAPLGGQDVPRGMPLECSVPDTPENRKLGQTYYEYYCLMCHGADGRGHTQVGGGYIPAPADLTSPRLDRLSDGELYVAMLSGRGHQDKNTGADVLAKTVPEDRRWPIVHYLRSF